MQSRTQSLFEAVANTAVGYFTAILSQILLFPLWGIHTQLRENMQMAAAFTLVSLARSYLLRRAFNRMHQQRLAHG